MGVDTIISTVTGAPQIELLRAAVSQGVRRFAPAEFEGLPANRLDEDALDRGKRDVLAWLNYYRPRIESTVFVCGVLYERFAPGGLHALRIGLGMDYGREGDYLVNPRNLLVCGPLVDVRGDNVPLCMTAAQDVARLVVRSLDMALWPAQQLFVGERMTVAQVVETVLRVRGESLFFLANQRGGRISDPSAGRRLQPHPQSRYLTVEDLESEVAHATVSNDGPQMMRALEHVATLIGRYDYHGAGDGGQMMSFEQFLRHHWDQIPVDD
jgi:hypothetical protein